MFVVNNLITIYNTMWKMTGGNYSYVANRREGIIPRWKNDGRELFLGGKTTGGNYS